MKEFSAVIGLCVILGTWSYGIARAQTYWKYVPAVGTLVGGVCIMEDYAIPKGK